MNICIIGTSHVSALQKSLTNKMRGKIQHDITFFASPWPHLGPLDQNFYVKDECLYTNSENVKKHFKFTSKKSDFIDPRNYDIFVLYGMFRIFLYDENKYSKEVLDMASKLYYSQNNRLVQMISYFINLLREISSKKIIISFEPNFKRNWNDYNPVSKHGLYKKSIMLAKNFFMFENLEIFPQPYETIENEVFTSDKFAKGSPIIDLGEESHMIFPETDIMHMNELYGDIWWKNFLIYLK